ncbi:hypothetical protein J2Q11_00145 [Tenacibaculum finnmarkense genomovar finnmarkense]|uniref:Uncharacterized protein n=1 Tax=Tenacibaculum finnmarkense genomovar finnmarkense TaxID=1458503 RepID=A0AAP1RGN2_9FLAO|nr:MULTISPECIES: hypothetical protein [Tenacibaculum]MBE7629189.1 hypothetical protein [Tenacibaculum piscium]MBE7653680.1 hypothetical protein [Tenacibaculum finnmarkense genomovar finnmarkense]MBE7669976.1 hypothetical protein [Tenacibaculum piscium]MBE7695984.1 hypothetical protein [Tenacibaculum finnmarkense genomovar finnmarkense]MCD8416801.1 hypothetical protein [Tenacibaculum finnmarkense genomovar finnmarkense]
MENLIKNLLEKSKKKTTVSYAAKNSRIKFDENFGKNKMEIASKLIGENSNSLSERLASK